jgi:hypothetical protein
VAKVSDNGIKKETWDETENSATGTCITARKPKSTKDAASLFDVDLNQWEPSGMRINAWDVINKKGERNTNYQVRVDFKRKIHTINPQDAVAIFREEVRDYMPSIPVVSSNKTDSSKECVIAISDTHIGMLSWHPETGSNYDIKIAQKNINFIISDLLNKTKVYNPRKYHLIIPGDFFHSNDPDGKTKKGTKLDMDGRWKKVYRCGCRIVQQSIDTLRLFAPVEVSLGFGNHDEDSIFYLREHIMAMYNGVKDVNIHDCIGARHYITIGCTDIGMTHDGETKQLFANFSNEYGWDNNKYHEFYVAHMHKQKLEDYHGLIVRRLRAACATDKWICDSGFTGTIKGAEANIYDVNTGHEAQIMCNVRFNEGCL